MTCHTCGKALTAPKRPRREGETIYKRGISSDFAAQQSNAKRPDALRAVNSSVEGAVYEVVV